MRMVRLQMGVVVWRVVWVWESDAETWGWRSEGVGSHYHSHSGSVVVEIVVVGRAVVVLGDDGDADGGESGFVNVRAYAGGGRVVAGTDGEQDPRGDD
jgi:uncharacterized protein YjlB